MSNLPFPEKILHQHIAVLGKTGSGKSSALRVIAEHLLDKNKRIFVVDPKGDWWGLKSSADGKSAGYPVIAFGDFKEPRATDVPINAASGKHVAELIASGNRPCIIGFRGWMPSQLTQFWLDFAPAIFNLNEGELYGFISEVQNFAPKGKILDPNSAKMIHWTNRIMAEGRGLGITFFLDSQRSQKVHNDTLDGCETLVAMRATHPAARQSIQDWIDGNGDPKVGKEVLATLASLARGEAWVWSPEAGFGPVRVQFPMFKTFDSFAPPQVQKKVSQASWAEVNLDQVREKLASVIAEQKANDPKELRQEVARLKAELAKKPAAAAKTEKLADPKAIERAVTTATRPLIARIVSMQKAARHTIERFTAAAGLLNEMVNIDLPAIPVPTQEISTPPTVQPMPVRPPTVAAVRRASVLPSNGNSAALPKGEQIVLRAIAQYDQGAQRDQLTVLTGYKRSTRDAYIQRLREKEFITENGNGSVVATQAGIDALGSDFEPLPTGAALQEYWLDRLPEGERKIFAALLESPTGLSRESLEERTGYKRSTRDAYIQRLQSRRLVEIMGRGEIRPSENLFA